MNEFLSPVLIAQRPGVESAPSTLFYFHFNDAHTGTFSSTTRRNPPSMHTSTRKNFPVVSNIHDLSYSFLWFVTPTSEVKTRHALSPSGELRESGKISSPEIHHDGLIGIRVK